MSDEELLWAASFEARRPGPRRPSAPGKVAFLFLTRGPLPLAPLWERFFNGTGGKGLFSVYVHTTPGYRLDFPPSSPFHRRQVPSKVPPRFQGLYDKHTAIFATDIDASLKNFATMLKTMKSQRIAALLRDVQAAITQEDGASTVFATKPSQGDGPCLHGT